MRKLKLDPEELQVETFAAGGRGAQIGTVRGNMPFKLPATDESDQCGGCSDPSGYNSCDCPTYRKTCAATCGIDYCTDVTCLTYGYCCP